MKAALLFLLIANSFARDFPQRFEGTYRDFNSLTKEQRLLLEISQFLRRNQSWPRVQALSTHEKRLAFFIAKVGGAAEVFNFLEADLQHNPSIAFPVDGKTEALENARFNLVLKFLYRFHRWPTNPLYTQWIKAQGGKSYLYDRHFPQVLKAKPSAAAEVSDSLYARAIMAKEFQKFYQEHKRLPDLNDTTSLSLHRHLKMLRRSSGRSPSSEKNHEYLKKYYLRIN